MSGIRRVAVLGAGVMGTGIATHLANAGIDSLLYDMKKEGPDPSVLANKAIQAAGKARPAPLFRGTDASRIRACNYDDDAALLETCDWIVEVVVERLDIKQKVFDWVAKNRRPGSIVSSNTSGIKLADMAATMSEEMRRHFLVTHFFNPVRYMRLLELVVGPDTDPAVAQQMADFGDRVLGKGIVWCKDTPNFIANRIGTYGMGSVFRHMKEANLTVGQVDAIFGTPMGRPSSAVFRTADIVGLDTLVHVFENLHAYLVDDEERDVFQVPDLVRTLVAAGQTGEKAGAGFYKKVKGPDGKSVILQYDFASGDYVAQEKVRADSIGKAKKAETPAGKIAAMVWGDDDAAKAAWRCTADTLIYAANRIPEIADDVVNVDRAMRWGFGWELGPFETWDAIGVGRSVSRMQEEGRTVPQWVLDMLASGRETFYARDGGSWNQAARKGGVEPVPQYAGQIFLADLKAAGKVVDRSVSADLVDLGDGVLGLEFHSKMNALDDVIFGMYGKALDKLDAGEFEALVVGNQDPRAFCAGANILMILMGAMQGQWDQIETQMRALQDLVMRAKYSARPVVTAPFGLTLGGGCEVSMHSAATVAGGELYMGLVEVGIGLIPGAGGCKEMVVRYLGDFPQDVEVDPNPFVQSIFQKLGLAKVSTSAEEARDMGFLRPTDRVVTNPDRLIAEAKRTAMGLAASGYVPARPRTVKVPGTTGRAAIELALYQMQNGGFASAHDVVVGKALANVLCGGDVPWGTVRTEQDLLDLEREAFLSLAGTPATQARMQHMLQTGKPLRN
ncbi:MAG: enoyl-CoA hydratase/isomerase family protein [Alphaproteobacteria bacterium]|nr:enoyl-CoA hydratase/isomerase family protein [Alphaproteobacteria bacterium]